MVNFFTEALLLFFILVSSVCQRLSLPDIDPLKKDKFKLNECQSCKVLTDSFSYWLDKTSRGKFEGGDAAWEEEKLKSYARSEIRLVEIQEGLCSEVKQHQDKCYSLAEEAEQAIERWWFKEDPNSDLHTWLCVETLKNCCPPQHYGQDCTACPVDKSNRICGDHGRCDGDGTRNGSGQCVCKRGYSGKFCEDCATNYYRESSEICRPCHKSCEGCSGDGPDSCDACAKGWQLQGSNCVDVDECINQSVCKLKHFCVNIEGSYTCKQCYKYCETCLGTESSNCTSCEPNHVLWSGNCLSDKHKSSILADTLRRLALYFGLLVILYVVFRNIRWLASLLIVIIAVFIYFSEINSEMSIINVGCNLLGFKIQWLF